ncbi:HAMP domain-containing histidine kinase [Candidatus Saccharibacteria bacterium]|nr:HAMP domain-containing histidine kinase [Candidatus Saccharibacteria bacterium]
MFHSAALKLSLWYLAIIMSLSIGSSIALYHVSSNELERSAQRPYNISSVTIGPNDLYTRQRQELLNQDRQRLKINLVIYNVVVLVVGGGVSYMLARRTLQPIEEILEAQTRFTADASHELRTPLTAIQSEIEVGLRNINLTKSEAVDLLKSNLEEVAKLKSLSEGLLTLARQDNDRDVDSTANLLEALEEALRPLQKLATGKKINLNNKVVDFKLRIDHKKLVELLITLLDNAIKYSSEGTQITLSSAKAGKNGILHIKDQGMGIKASDLPHIFNRFYRADSSRSKDQTAGYGLGLAIAKKIVEQYGGAIVVKSSPNKGSTFSVQLPLS